MDSLGGVTRYTYDEEGNVSSETSALNATTAYTYGEGLLVEAEIANRAKVDYIYTVRSFPERLPDWAALSMQLFPVRF